MFSLEGSYFHLFGKYMDFLNKYVTKNAFISPLTFQSFNRVLVNKTEHHRGAERKILICFSGFGL